MLKNLLKEKKIDFINPRRAFYFIINIKEYSDVYAPKVLEHKKFTIVPGTGYCEDYQNYIRASIAVDEYSFNSFII